MQGNFNRTDWTELLKFLPTKVSAFKIHMYLKERTLIGNYLEFNFFQFFIKLFVILHFTPILVVPFMWRKIWLHSP